MKKLDLFIIKSYIGPLVLTFFIALFVLLMQFLWKYIDDFVGKGFDMMVIAELMYYASATFVPMALPLAVLLSSLMLFGNLGENYELAAIKSAGISLNRVFRPLVFVAIIVSFIAFYFSNNVLPVANQKFRTLLRDVRQQKPAVQIDAGVFYSEIENYVIRIGEKDQDGITIRDVMIYDHRKGNGNTNVTVAKSGKMEMSGDKRFLVFTLVDGYNYDENIKSQQRLNQNTFPMQRTHFQEMVRRINLSEFDFKKSDNAIHRNNYEMMNLSQLAYYRDSLKVDMDSNLRIFSKFVTQDFGFLKVYENGKNDSISKSKPVPAQIVDTLQQTVSEMIDRDVLLPGVIKMPKKNNPSVAEAPVVVVESKFDTVNFNDTIIKNFQYADALRLINNALVGARNASYMSDFAAQNKEAKEKLIAKHQIELHRKFTLSLACLLFFFIGASLGAIIRKGGLGTPLVMSILLFVTYYVFAIIGEKSAKVLAMTPFFGMWLSTFIYLPLSIFVTYKATADSPLLDREFYVKFYEKILSRIPFVKL
ncbi:MAG: LptF/LptG family permease [Bacteroidales bacterium]|nr:LptF/LptG family permease [Bacteroidales bacterium]